MLNVEVNLMNLVRILSFVVPHLLAQQPHFDRMPALFHKQKQVFLDKNIPEMPYSVGLT